MRCESDLIVAGDALHLHEASHSDAKIHDSRRQKHRAGAKKRGQERSGEVGCEWAEISKLLLLRGRNEERKLSASESSEEYPVDRQLDGIHVMRSETWAHLS